MKTLLIILLSLTTACTPHKVKDTLLESTFKLDNKGNPLKHKKLPITFYIDSSVPKDKIAAFKQTADDLNKSLGVRAVNISLEKVTDETFETHSDVNQIFWITTKKDTLSPGEEAKTQLYWTDYESIVNSDIDFNSFQFEGFKDYDLGTLIRHEMMHSLGFCHVNDNTDIMNPTLGKHEVRLFVSSDQYEAFHKVYDIHATALSQNKK